jgi:hypothetical protein
MARLFLSGLPDLQVRLVKISQREGTGEPSKMWRRWDRTSAAGRVPISLVGATISQAGPT